MRQVPKSYNTAPSRMLISVAQYTRGRAQAAALAELEVRGLQLSPAQQLTAGLKDWTPTNAHVPSETYAPN